MTIQGLWPVFACGLFGGFAIEVLRWWRIKDADNLPAYASSPFYWTVTVLMILVGGILAVLYGVDSRSAIMVVNVGASAPALLSTIAKSPTAAADLGGAEGDPQLAPTRTTRSAGGPAARPTASANAKPAPSLRRFLSMSV